MWGDTNPKLLKSVQNVGSKLTYQQMAKFAERFTTPRTFVRFSILLRTLVRILQCYWFI